MHLVRCFAFIQSDDRDIEEVMAESEIDIPRGSVHGTLLRPFRVASMLTVGALVISLLFLTYTAWSSAQHLLPLERHLLHMQALQDASFSIQDILVHHIKSGDQPDPAEISRVSRQLQKILESGDSLHPDTPEKLKEARSFLDSSVSNKRVGLLAALSIVRKVLAEENGLQQATVLAVHNASLREMTIAAVTLLLLPLAAMLLLAYMRRRSFGPLQSLGDMLENVGNLEFRPTQLPEPSDPFFEVYDRYNRMTERLKRVQHENTELQNNLEAQVKAATQTLLRQQRDLADGARLAAIGEFSARLAHELRNPLSGILLALRNMERETDDPDSKQRYNAIIEEMERIKRLLAGLLDKSPQAPETPVRLELQELVGDVVTLFRYQVPQTITINQTIAKGACNLPRDTFRQVLLNLLRNSVDAMEDEPGTITIAAEQDRGQLHLCVSDTGPGYPEDLLRYGIRPYFSQKTSGSGLGLAVVKRLVRSAGGELNLSNLAQGGACAEIVLPCEAN